MARRRLDPRTLRVAALALGRSSVRDLQGWGFSVREARAGRKWLRLAARVLRVAAKVEELEAALARGRRRS